MIENKIIHQCIFCGKILDDYDHENSCARCE